MTSALLSSSAFAFSIPQPKAEVVASRLALLEYQLEDDDPQAHFLIGVMKLSGRYMPVDVDAGLSHLRIAAELDYGESVQTLADVLYEGKLAPRDLLEAAHWYRQLIPVNEGWARFRLGFIYAVGAPGIVRDCGKAIDHFERVSDLRAQANLVWVLATCPDSQHRDGQRALDLGLSLIETEGSSSTLLDNLAAAYAELGRFEVAVETQKKAIRQLLLEQNTQYLAEFESRLDAYLSERPFRDLAPDLD
ncbi:tetratricopeptide repeat protein [Paraferrimonas sedimenticola]|uniref:tetratricopeptide repeat protein n=1 Tax=Paraferrimonas sedimenticola TaxID=375674 RepID=UPI001473C187|nr:SEL1-like repeat protein [Paraferrimonas sedimenticola]